MHEKDRNLEVGKTVAPLLYTITSIITNQILIPGYEFLEDDEPDWINLFVILPPNEKRDILNSINSKLTENDFLSKTGQRLNAVMYNFDDCIHKIYLLINDKYYCFNISGGDKANLNEKILEFGVFEGIAFDPDTHLNSQEEDEDDMTTVSTELVELREIVYPLNYIEIAKKNLIVGERLIGCSGLSVEGFKSKTNKYNNQDGIEIITDDDHAQLLLGDGVGGLIYKHATRMALEEFLNCDIRSQSEIDNTLLRLKEQIKDQIKNNQSIPKYIKPKELHSATTLVGGRIVEEGGKLFLYSVGCGDSQILVIRDGIIELIHEIQGSSMKNILPENQLYAWLLFNKLKTKQNKSRFGLSDELISKSGEINIVSNTIGNSQVSKLKIKKTKLEKGDKVLFVSDGFWESLRYKPMTLLSIIKRCTDQKGIFNQSKFQEYMLKAAQSLKMRDDSSYALADIN